MPDAKTIAQALGGARKSGGEWVCRCPAHDDHTPSLSLTDGAGGTVLWYCHAGCGQSEVQEVLIRLGLLQAPAPSTPKPRKHSIEAVYDYHGADGTLRFQVIRLQPKSFRQRRPDGQGGWIWNVRGVEMVPYRLPELLQSSNEPLFLAEGEKGVEALREIGLIATCSPGGAGKWRPDYASYFSGRDVVVLPDNDQVGERHADDIARSLKSITASICVVRLPDLATKCDVFDWIAAGGTAEQLLKLFHEHEPIPVAADYSWQENCIKGKNGAFLPNHANALTALRDAVAWTGVIGFDEMRSEDMLIRPILRSGAPREPAFPHPCPWTDSDDAVAQEWFQRNGLTNISITTVSIAISQRASELAYHPVRDWLKSLKWDGIPRISGGTTEDGEIFEPWTTRYLGTEHTSYSRAVGELWLVSAVARVFQPGCKADHMLILEGPQGSGKSTACRILCGEEHFSDNLPDVSTKDAAAHLSGKWIVEVSELDAMTRAESSAVKAFLSRSIDKFRPPYGRRDINRPRQCVFIGTTNKSFYLKDETGGRRYWPLETGHIDLEALERDREHLWAEVVHMYEAGHHWHLTDPEIIALAENAQEDRYEPDAWEDPIKEYLADKESVTVGEVMTKALEIGKAQMHRNAQNRVMAILPLLGWKRVARTGKARKWKRQHQIEPVT